MTLTDEQARELGKMLRGFVDPLDERNPLDDDYLISLGRIAFRESMRLAEVVGEK